MPWQGLKTDLRLTVNQLLEVIKQLNEWIPNKINKTWDFNDNQKSVNDFHTHFPEHNAEQDPTRRKQLREYNDLIHDIEIKNRVNSRKSETLQLLVCPDSPVYEKVPYNLEDYSHFSGDRNFGDLTIGFNHIGRHPLELYASQDIDVPPDQIVTQTLIGPVHYLFFYNYKYDINKFNDFYYSSGIKWPYKLDDPRLAIGLVNIGNLTTINDNVLSNEEIFSIVKSCNKILNWSIK